MDMKANVLEVDGVLRPRMNSLGGPIASTEREIVDFWRWFGDSKLVDANGKPLVVYHGTTADFDVFSDNVRGLHFVSPSAAWVSNWIARDASGDQHDGAVIMPLYVSASNPFDYENKAHVNRLASKASLGSLAISQIRKGSWHRLEDRTLVAAIKSLGFDGLYVKEDGVKNLAVFSPEQIKSATCNEFVVYESNQVRRVAVRRARESSLKAAEEAAIEQELERGSSSPSRPRM